MASDDKKWVALCLDGKTTSGKAVNRVSSIFRGLPA